MASIELGDRIWFQVPTPAGLIDVAMPNLSVAEANKAAMQLRAIVLVMFGNTVVITDVDTSADGSVVKDQRDTGRTP